MENSELYTDKSGDTWKKIDWPLGDQPEKSTHYTILKVDGSAWNAGSGIYYTGRGESRFDEAAFYIMKSMGCTLYEKYQPLVIEGEGYAQYNNSCMVTVDFQVPAGKKFKVRFEEIV